MSFSFLRVATASLFAVIASSAVAQSAIDTRQLVVLDCRIDGQPSEIEVDFDKRTANRVPARITDTEITWENKGGSVTIKRFTGEIVVFDSGRALGSGICRKRAGRQF